MKTRWFHVAAKICKFFGQYRLILDREEKRPYLHRYYLFNTRWLAPIFPKLSYRIVLHHTVRSDEDGLHDHPWSWWSKILSGGYDENVPGGNIWRGPEGGWRRAKATDFHRLILNPDHVDEETWSLFVMGPKEKKWGFLNEDGDWVYWREYLEGRKSHY